LLPEAITIATETSYREFHLQETPDRGWLGAVDAARIMTMFANTPDLTTIRIERQQNG